MAGLAALGALVFLGLAFFAFRNAALRGILDAKLRAFAKSSPGTVVTVNEARFHGLAGVELSGVRLRSGANAVELGRISVSASFWRLLLGRVRLKHLALGDLRVDLGRLPADATAASPPGPTAPPPAAQQGQAGNTSGTSAAPDYGATVARLLDLYFNRIPDSLLIERVFIHSAFADVRQALYIPRLALGGPAFTTTLEVFDQGRKWSCTLAGGVGRGKKRFDLRLLPDGGAAAALPFLERQWGLKVGFGSLAIGLQSRGRSGRVLRLDGSLAVAGLVLNQPRIAAADVVLDSAALDFALRIDPGSIELAAPSRISFNRMAFQPRVKLTTWPTRKVEIEVPVTRFAADDLFASLPAGLFTRLAGIRTSGELVFHLGFAIDLSRPEDLDLVVGLEKSGFRIRRFGNADLRHFASPFLYTPYEKDRPARSFMVGPENPSFRSLERIPSSLKYAVMISEDGAFFSHVGFLLEPFKNSIVANLRAGRFVRGASTISMQLVKNLYLRRHKTIARKLEELLITWLIEANRLVGKERMLETYLNIIEWGPDVYGAQEAARFYFAKDVEELTLAEAIFMAAIIPRPKRFMALFGDDQRLRPWLQRYYADVAAKMLAREWIIQLDHDSLLPEVTLTGPARLLLKGAEVVDEAAAQDLGITIDDTLPMPDR
ncbi:MAG: transglycosylase domain-containing protein [Acidobacteria bacterium]|jgi:hypothetical protein|nr:transglycosylase domain-containing protein [Acidobacteriota bacterium]